MTTIMPSLPIRCALALALGLVTVAPALAQEAAQPAAPSRRTSSSASPLEVISKGIKLKADPVDAADFVKESRPADSTYIPVHSARPEPKGGLLTADQLRAKEAELDGLTRRHDRLTGRRAPKVEYRPLSLPAAPKAKPGSKPAAAPAGAKAAAVEKK